MGGGRRGEAYLVDAVDPEVLEYGVAGYALSEKDHDGG